MPLSSVAQEEFNYTVRDFIVEQLRFLANDIEGGTESDYSMSLSVDDLSFSVSLHVYREEVDYPEGEEEPPVALPEEEEADEWAPDFPEEDFVENNSKPVGIGDVQNSSGQPDAESCVQGDGEALP